MGWVSWDRGLVVNDCKHAKRGGVVGEGRGGRGSAKAEGIRYLSSKYHRAALLCSPSASDWQVQW